jgi:hypothetical protein
MSVAVEERPVLAADKPELWPSLGWEKILTLSWKDYQPIQLEGLQRRFEQLRGQVGALERLADRQGVTRIETFSQALPLFFDHRVMKNYPLHIIENRDFPKLTAWLNRMTTHPLDQMDLTGLKTLDDWMTRLDDFGMIIGHSTGTTGKLSFIPRSKTEWAAWDEAYYQAYYAASGIDTRRDHMPAFFPGYRSGHQMMLKMQTLFSVPAAGGWENYHTLYPNRLSSDLLALAGRMQSAEDRGEIDKLGLDPALLEARQEMIAQGRRREQDMQAWFEKIGAEFRDKRVKMGGTYGDLVRMAMYGKSKGINCQFGPGSYLVGGGGMKGFKDAPPDWKQLILDFYGFEKMVSVYGMSECMGVAPLCKCGHFHFMPWAIPILVDRDAVELPRQGVQTGRLALFDLLAQTYWGGFISGDQVTMHWDEDCACGWKGPYIENEITRFAEMEGGDDKITCAGSQAAYNEFMDYVMEV